MTEAKIFSSKFSNCLLLQYVCKCIMRVGRQIKERTVIETDRLEEVNEWASEVRRCNTGGTNSQRSRYTHVFVFAAFIAIAVQSRGADPLTIWASDASAQRCLNLLGQDVAVGSCEVSSGVFCKRLCGLSASAKLTIFATRGQMKPMTVERLKNQGHVIQFLEPPRQDGCDLSQLLALRKTCAILIRCFPESAFHFRDQLAKIEREYKLKIARRFAIALAA